jgi:hypothetical protein
MPSPLTFKISFSNRFIASVKLYAVTKMQSHSLISIISASVAAVAFLSSNVLADNSLTAREKSQGWDLLFDGKSLDQWRNYQRKDIRQQWAVEEGMMILAGDGAGDLISRKQYKNFDFKLDWKIEEGGNSGIFFLADETPDKIYYNSPEVQLLDNERHPDRKLENHRSGSLYDLIASPPASQKIAGEWNSLRILVENRYLKVWQNEFLTVDIVMGSREWDRIVAGSKFNVSPGFGKNERGHLGVQDHGDKVFLKNLRVREL